MQRSRLSGFVGFLVLCLLPFSLGAEEPPANVGGFITELMQLQATKGGLQLGLWLPSDFFAESIYAQGGITRAAAAEQVAILKPYIIVGVASGTNDALGRSTYATEDALRDRTRLINPDGEEIPPLAAVPPRIASTLASFKAAFAASGGAQNENTYFLVFSGTDAHEKMIVDTEKKDRLTILLKKDDAHNEAKFVWLTPFDAITAASPCHQCHEKLSHKWSFCPYCGAKVE